MNTLHWSQKQIIDFYNHHTTTDVIPLYSLYIISRHDQVTDQWLERFPYGITVRRITMSPNRMEFQQVLDEDVDHLSTGFCKEYAREIGLKSCADVEKVVALFAGAIQGNFRSMACIAPTPPLTPITTDSESDNELDYDIDFRSDVGIDLYHHYSNVSFNDRDIDLPRPKVKKISVRAW